MTEVAFACGLGFAPAATITAAATVDLSTVDGNQIIITGTTAISSFGSAPNLFRIIEWVSATPLTPAAGFVPIFNTPRTANPGEFSIWISDSLGRWTEICGPQTLLLQAVINGRIGARTVYTSSQTITIPAFATRATIRMWGGTGGSGGVSSSNSSGSGAPGYLEIFLTGLTPGLTIIFTCGAAGPAGAATPTAGGNGTASTLVSGTQTIPTLTANASNGTPAVSGNVVSSGTVGGTATGGDINIQGQTGVSGSGSTLPAAGGSNFYGHGADGVGGSGNHAGNPGNPGGLIIEWYS